MIPGGTRSKERAVPSRLGCALENDHWACLFFLYLDFFLVLVHPNVLKCNAGSAIAQLLIYIPINET
jgi:hypothetical protein